MEEDGKNKSWFIKFKKAMQEIKDSIPNMVDGIVGSPNQQSLSELCDEVDERFRIGNPALRCVTDFPDMKI